MAPHEALPEALVNPAHLVKLRHLAEKSLHTVVAKLFPSQKIIYNARKEAGIVSYLTDKKRYLELDVWIPDINLGFEYQVCSVRGIQ